MERPEVVPIKNDDLKSCASCGGQLGGLFWPVKIHVASVDPTRANGLMGTAQILGGNLAIAQAMSYDSVADMSREPMSSRFLCSDCYSTKLLPIFREDSE